MSLAVVAVLVGLALFLAREARLRARQRRWIAEREGLTEATIRDRLRAHTGAVEASPQRAPIDGRGFDE